MEINTTIMQEKSYKNGAMFLVFPMGNFIDNDKNDVSIDELPKDVEFQSIQGFDTLMVCFYSKNKKMSYWFKIPFKIGDTFSVEASTSIVTNIEVNKLISYMFEEDESIFKAGYDAHTIGWQKALTQWKSDFNKETKNGLRWENNPFILVCEFKRSILGIDRTA